MDLVGSWLDYLAIGESNLLSTVLMSSGDPYLKQVFLFCTFRSPMFLCGGVKGIEIA